MTDTSKEAVRAIQKRIGSTPFPDGFQGIADDASVIIDALAARLVEVEAERDEARMFLDNAVSNAPEPLVALGGWLADMLDEDQWPTAERYLNAAVKLVQARAAKLAEVEVELGRVKADVFVSGQWHCPKCKFTLQQMSLNARDGTITAQDKPGEPCPNCATPLWRTTWKQEAHEMLARAEEQATRAQVAEAALDADTHRQRGGFTGGV